MAAISTIEEGKTFFMGFANVINALRKILNCDRKRARKGRWRRSWFGCSFRSML